MKNLLITGGSQGIGKATALEAAKKGMFIGINYNSNDKAAEETLSAVSYTHLTLPTNDRV